MAARVLPVNKKRTNGGNGRSSFYIKPPVSAISKIRAHAVLAQHGRGFQRNEWSASAAAGESPQTAGTADRGKTVRGETAGGTAADVQGIGGAGYELRRRDDDVGEVFRRGIFDDDVSALIGHSDLCAAGDRGDGRHDAVDRRIRIRRYKRYPEAP